MGGRRRAGCLLSTVLLAELLGGAGCLRFAYSDVDGRGPVLDAGMDGGQRRPVDAGDLQDAQPMAAGRSGRGAAGAGGRAGQSASGSGGRAAGGSNAAGQVSDAGALDASHVDAALSEAGTSDAASGDGGTDSGSVGGSAPTCIDGIATGAGVLECNGFEVYPFVDQWNFNIIMNADDSQSTAIKHSGVSSMRATTRSAQLDTSLRLASTKLNQQRSGEIWSRYYYYVPSSTVITWWISSGVISEIGEPYDGFDLLIHANYVEIESMLGYFDEGVQFPRDRWVCVELHAVVDEINGYFEAFLDGMLAARTVRGNTVPAGGFTCAEYGIHYAEARQGAVEVYVDDVALGTQRIPCQ